MLDTKYALAEPLLQRMNGSSGQGTDRVLLPLLLPISFGAVTLLGIRRNDGGRSAVQEPVIGMGQVEITDEVVPPLVKPTKIRINPGVEDTEEQREMWRARKRKLDEEEAKLLAPNKDRGYDYGTHAFRQDTREVIALVSVPSGTRAKMLNVTISTKALSIGFIGKDPIVSGQLHLPIDLCASFWQMEMGGSLVEVTLTKKDGSWWDRLFASVAFRLQPPI